MDKTCRAFCTVQEMLLDRGYTVQLQGHAVLAFKSFNQVLALPRIGPGAWAGVDAGLACFSGFYENPVTRDVVYLCFICEPSIRTQSIIAIFSKIKASAWPCRHVLLVTTTDSAISPTTQKFIQKSKVRVETFNESELLCNIMRHVSQPRITVLTAQQKADFLAATGFELGQLPKILGSDPVARYFGLRNGDILKMVRKSDSAGESVAYRALL